MLARRVLRVNLGLGAFAIFVVLWLGFAFALVVDRGILDTVWQGLRGLAMPIQMVVWVVLLPITIGLWIWESTCSPIAGSLLVCEMIALDARHRPWSPARLAATAEDDRGESPRVRTTPGACWGPPDRSPLT
jgi:hypothetical protein